MMAMTRCTYLMGKRMQVLFQDGSKVHLNSGSRIRYPKKISVSPERKVYLEGEAWFEVANEQESAFYRGSFLYGYKRCWVLPLM